MLSTTSTKVPGSNEQQLLASHNLGVKNLEFLLTTQPRPSRKGLNPPLKDCGGFVLCESSDGSENASVLPIIGIYDGACLKDRNKSGSGNLYVKPIQRDVTLPEVTNLLCLQIILLYHYIICVLFV